MVAASTLAQEGILWFTSLPRAAQRCVRCMCLTSEGERVVVINELDRLIGADSHRYPCSVVRPLCVALVFLLTVRSCAGTTHGATDLKRGDLSSWQCQGLCSSPSPVATELKLDDLPEQDDDLRSLYSTWRDNSHIAVLQYCERRKIELRRLCA